MSKVPIANRASCKSGQFSFSLLCVSQKLKFLEVLDLIRTAGGKNENRNFYEVQKLEFRWIQVDNQPSIGLEWPGVWSEIHDEDSSSNWVDRIPYVSCDKRTLELLFFWTLDVGSGFWIENPRNPRNPLSCDFRTEIVCKNPIFVFSTSSLGLLKSSAFLKFSNDAWSWRTRGGPI